MKYRQLTEKAVRGNWYEQLCVLSKPYRKHYGSHERCVKIKNLVDLDERPAIVAKHSRIGNWESNTIMGKS